MRVSHGQKHEIHQTRGKISKQMLSHQKKKKKKNNRHYLDIFKCLRGKTDPIFIT